MTGDITFGSDGRTDRRDRDSQAQPCWTTASASHTSRLHNNYQGSVVGGATKSQYPQVDRVSASDTTRSYTPTQVVRQLTPFQYNSRALLRHWHETRRIRPPALSQTHSPGPHSFTVSHTHTPPT